MAQMSDQSHPTEETARVVPFRPRGVGPRGWHWPRRRPHNDERPLASLNRYERADSEDDYRHRMTINALALLVTTILVLVGIWLTVSIAEMRRNQDCYLQGQKNCDHVVTPPRDPR
jgi:hypothetical protein